MEKRVLMILADGFEETEAIAVADVIRRLGMKLDAAGFEMSVRGAHGFILQSDLLLADISVDDYDAVFLPGGMPGSTNLLKSVLVRDVLLKMAQENKVISAICAAPIVLASCGLLENKTFTMYPGFDEYLNGNVPTGKPAERDGNIVTGKGPGTVFAFAAELAAALGADTGTLYDGMFVKL